MILLVEPQKDGTQGQRSSEYNERSQIMAERITKTRECDRTGCRRRRDVQYYEMTMLDAGSDEVAAASGELCPAHRNMVVRFIDNLFKNTKEYPADPD